MLAEDYEKKTKIIGFKEDVKKLKIPDNDATNNLQTTDVINVVLIVDL